MDRRWPLIPRCELDLIVTALSDPARGGAVLTGGAGVGKTTLARMATAELDSPVRWIAGTESARGIPLGAFAHLVRAPAAQDPVSFLATAREELLHDHGDGSDRLTLGVDDGHLLDPLSATFLHQLTLDREVHVVATVRSGEAVPDAITSLWKDEHLLRVDVTPFTREQSIDLVESVLDGPLEDLSAELIWRASGGNALFVRHLVEGARDAGTLRRTGGVWQLRGGTAITPELASLLEHRLEHLPAEVVDVLQLLAFCEPLDLDALCSLTGDTPVEEAERQGLIDITDDGPRLTVRYTHPLFGEVIRREIGRVAGRRLRGQLVDALTGHPAQGPVERILLADLALDSNRPVDADLLTSAAHDAITLANAPLAERLARAAHRQSADFDSAELLARALMWLGRATEAEELLAAYDPESLDQARLIRWGTSRISNLFWAMGSADRADAVLAILRDHVTHPGLHRIVDGIECACAVFANRPHDALTTARTVLDAEHASPWAVEWACFGGGLALAVMGRGHEVPAMATRRAAVAHRVDGLLHFPAALGEVLAALHVGDLAAAEHLALRYRDEAESQSHSYERVVSSGLFIAWGLANILVGAVEIARGRFGDATRRLEQAVAALDPGTAPSGGGAEAPGPSGAVSWSVPAYIALARGCAALGRFHEARNAVVQARSRSGRHVAVFEPTLVVAEAWCTAGRGEVSVAVTQARRAAAIAAAAGQSAIEAEALHTATRFGDRTTAGRLTALADVCDGALVPIMAAQARALADGDGDLLRSAAVRFEDIGALPDAADAYAQAAVAYADGAPGRAALESAAAAAALAVQCDGFSSPALEQAAHPLPLTSREREIASMAAAGLSNRQIAERLVVSVRTVEGHIYRACTKLDVSDRGALADMLRDAGR